MMANLINDIFNAHDSLAAVEKSTLEYGFDWKIEDGIILYPHNFITDYISGVSKILFPQLNVTVLSELTTPTEWENIAKEKQRSLVILCKMQSYLSHDIGIEYGEILKIVPNPLAGRIVTIRQFGDFLPEGSQKTKFFDYFRKTSFPADAANRKKISNAFELFKDPLSQITFAQILKRYLLRADTLIPTVNTPMYFEDMFVMGDREVIVDCGGFTGDTLQYYLSSVRNDFAEYHIFEPDPCNFQKLLANVDKLTQSLAAKVMPHRKAVSHTPGKLEFNGVGALESRVIPGGTVSVESVPLDTALKDVDPTLIKMDLEGFESFALLGARNTIRRCHPILSICVYHYPFDLWELPLLINSIDHNYHFFLRAYAEMFDYVCYCVPEERLAEVYRYI